MNSASSAVTVRFIIATYSVSAFYNDVTWQGTTDSRGATSSSATTDATGFYQFTNIPFGMRSVEVAPRLSLVPGSVSAFGAQNANVQFSVVNSASSAVTVRFIIATYSVSAFYNDVTWQGTTVWSCSGLPQGSGSTTTLSPDQTVAAGGGGSPTVIAVASSVTQVADITLAGGGSQAQIQLLDFRSNGGSCSSGSRVGMSGVNFTDVQLRDPSNAIRHCSGNPVTGSGPKTPMSSFRW